MRISNWSASKTGYYWVGITLVFALIGAGSVSAETFRQGGSTAIIQQSGGGKSESQVTRYKDGQKIITRNGRSTDITIQRKKGVSPSKINREYPTTRIDRFERWFVWDRFPSIDPDNAPSGAIDRSKGRLSAQDAFKQRMIDRMSGR